MITPTMSHTRARAISQLEVRGLRRGNAAGSRDLTGQLFAGYAPAPTVLRYRVR